MSATFTESITLVKVECGECGGTYAISDRFREHKRQNSGFWHCPYCDTGWGFAKSALRQELDAKTAELQRAQQQAANDRTARIAAEERATKDQRKVKRTEAGVCPHCNRQFRALCRHMATKHGVKNGEPARPKKP